MFCILAYPIAPVISSLDEIYFTANYLSFYDFCPVTTNRKKDQYGYKITYTDIFFTHNMAKAVILFDDIVMRVAETGCRVWVCQYAKGFLIRLSSSGNIGT